MISFLLWGLGTGYTWHLFKYYTGMLNPYVEVGPATASWTEPETISLGPNTIENSNIMVELYLHMQIGGKEKFYFDATTMDFSCTSQKELGLSGMKVGEKRLGNLFNAGVNEYSLSFGKLWFEYMKVKINLQ